MIDIIYETLKWSSHPQLKTIKTLSRNVYNLTTYRIRYLSIKSAKKIINILNRKLYKRLLYLIDCNYFLLEFIEKKVNQLNSDKKRSLLFLELNIYFLSITNHLQ